MPDWLMLGLAQIQSGIIQTLASAMRDGGIAAAGLAFALGALHAMTPGHGKAALAAYFLGREARIGKGLRIALQAALLHVLSGFAIFLVLRFVVEQTPALSGRGSPGFIVMGYGLIVVAGLIMVWQSLHPSHSNTDGSHTLTAGIGFLPCPLTISVLGFAWTQSSIMMVGVVLVSLALGISLTIGLVALLAIIARRGMGAAIGAYGPSLDRWGRVLQGAAGLLIILIGLYTIRATAI